MKILVFPFGSYGDVHPMVGLALRLKARGHDVTIAVNGYFRELVERAGIDFVEQGSREEFVTALSHPDLWNPIRSFGHLFRSGIARALRPQYELIVERSKSGQLLAINNCLGFGARIAHDRLQTPLATVHLQPSVLWSKYESPTLPGFPGPWAPQWLRQFQYWFGEKFFIDRTIDGVVNGFRAELGLPSMRKTTRWWQSPDENVCMFPSWYAAPQPDWPKALTMTSFPLWDESDIALPRPELELFLDKGPPPIVFAPGSANAQAADFFHAAANACVLLKKRGILLTRFPEQLPKNLPPDIASFDFIPFSQVLPRSAALIHHGGIGTAAQAMRAGIPQLIMPLAHDQPDNAARLKRLGVGDALPPSRFQPANIADCLTRLLESPEVKHRCLAVQRQLVDAQPLDDACAAIERLGRSRGL